jgi:hypothetical protein
MSTTTSKPAAVRGSIASLQFLGILGMFCAPGLLVDACIRYARRDFGDGVIASSSIAGLIYIMGWTASMIGFRTLRLTGNGVFTGTVFYLQMFGLALAAGQQVMELSATPTLLQSSFFGICDTAWPVSHLFMLVVGGMVLAAGRIHGAVRFAALGCGLALPATAVSAVLNHYVFVFGFGAATTLCFGLVGLTVYRAGSGRAI